MIDLQTVKYVKINSFCNLLGQTTADNVISQSVRLEMGRTNQTARFYQHVWIYLDITAKNYISEKAFRAREYYIFKEKANWFR